jgi:hypothetical protein
MSADRDRPIEAGIEAGIEAAIEAGIDGISVRGCPPDSLHGAVAVTVLLSALAAAGTGESGADLPRPAAWPARHRPRVSWAGRSSPPWRPVL